MVGEGFFFFFNFGFGRWFLDEMERTETWFMTTRKSVYLSPSLSICYSSLVVFPLKMIFMESAGMPLVVSIWCLRAVIWVEKGLRWHWDRVRLKRLLLSNFSD